MNSLCRQLNLTHLATQLPDVLETARLEQRSYAAFLTHALQTELTGRLARAQARRPVGALRLSLSTQPVGTHDS